MFIIKKMQYYKAPASWALATSVSSLLHEEPYYGPYIAFEDVRKDQAIV